MLTFHVKNAKRGSSCEPHSDKVNRKAIGNVQSNKNNMFFKSEQSGRWSLFKTIVLATIGLIQ